MPSIEVEFLSATNQTSTNTYPKDQEKVSALELDLKETQEARNGLQRELRQQVQARRLLEARARYVREGAGVLAFHSHTYRTAPDNCGIGENKFV